MSEVTVKQLIQQAVEMGASDLHLSVQVPPVIRRNGELQRLDASPLTPADTLEMAEELWRAYSGQREEPLPLFGTEFSWGIEGLSRFRVNIYSQRGSVALAVKLLPLRVPRFDELNLPTVLRDLADQRDGLVLITGASGSGKSATLAAMVDRINETRSAHIITVEEPIEYLHRHQRALVHQREVGSDGESFAATLRAALRQDPDVLMVGELPDVGTLSTALTAAETGKLVLAALPTVDSASTVERLTAMFPSHQQEAARAQLATVLRAIVTQKLMSRSDEPGMVPAVEVLVATPAVRSLLREGRTHQLRSAIQTGGRYGMMTMDDHIEQLRQEGRIGRG